MRNVIPAILFFIAWVLTIVGTALINGGAALIVVGLGIGCLGLLLLER